MLFINRPNNYNEWIAPAINKIFKTIDSCRNEDHIKATQQMIENFIIVMALENTKTETLEETLNLFWLRLNLQRQMLITF